MSQNKETSTSETKQSSVKKARVFPIASLRSNSVKLFGCTSSTFDGAFYGRSETECSIEEAKKIIKLWLNKNIAKKEDK